MNAQGRLGRKITPEKELGEALRFVGFGSEQITHMARDRNFLRRILHVLESSKPKPKERTRAELIIDLSVAPFVPKGHELTSHAGRGLLYFDSSSLRYHSKDEVELKFGESVSIEQVLEAYGGSLLANANCLDFLLTNQDLIPERFKPWEILFLATRYKGCVRAMYYEKWAERYSWSVVGVNKPLKPNQCIMTIDLNSVKSA